MTGPLRHPDSQVPEERIRALAAHLPTYDPREPAAVQAERVLRQVGQLLAAYWSEAFFRGMAAGAMVNPAPVSMILGRCLHKGCDSQCLATAFAERLGRPKEDSVTETEPESPHATARYGSSVEMTLRNFKHGTRRTVSHLLSTRSVQVDARDLVTRARVRVNWRPVSDQEVSIGLDRSDVGDLDAVGALDLAIRVTQVNL